MKLQFILLATILLHYGNEPFLDVYASRNMCTKITVSLMPWEIQGFAGYNC